MPLPAPNTPWPPPELARVHVDLARWSAWWSGDPDQLSHVYGGTAAATEERSWQRREGLTGDPQRWFWGQRTRGNEQRTKLHVPVAAEIAQVSADLLFGQPPTIVCVPEKDAEVKPTQDVIDRVVGEEAHTLLHESAEAGSALGHSWLRVGIDKSVDPTGPIISHVDADAAFPIFAWGRLQEVTFLSEWHEDGDTYFRHMERHAVGRVEHALYRGDATGLGQLVPLSSHERTRGLAAMARQFPGGAARELPDGTVVIATGLSRLDVVGVSNARTRTWRKNARAKDLGRADISGVEGDLDALDDAVSSWMRDVRHGRSRIHVPQFMLESKGPGKGATADVEKELYVGLNAPPNMQGTALPITATQFKIRWQEHEATVAALLERIFSGAGYSPQTFGLADVAALTAMESWSRQVRTQNTRNAKVRRWRRALMELVRIVLEYDRVHFGGKGDPEAELEVEFQQTVSESAQGRAQTAQLLSAARAASIRTLVAMQHPDRDAKWVEEEVKLIKEEDAAANTVPDPLDGFTDLETTPAGGDPDPDDDQDEDEDEGPAPRRRRTRAGVPA